jgi:hypothetical protein
MEQLVNFLSGINRLKPGKIVVVLGEEIRVSTYIKKCLKLYYKVN